MIKQLYLSLPLEERFVFMQLGKGRVEVTLPDLLFISLPSSEGIVYRSLEFFLFGSFSFFLIE